MKGPVAAAMHMDDDMQFYSGGIYEPEECLTRCDARRVQIFSFLFQNLSSLENTTLCTKGKKFIKFAKILIPKGKNVYPNLQLEQKIIILFLQSLMRLIIIKFISVLPQSRSINCWIW